MALPHLHTTHLPLLSCIQLIAQGRAFFYKELLWKVLNGGWDPNTHTTVFLVWRSYSIIQTKHTPTQCFAYTTKIFEWDSTESSSHPIYKHHETYLSWIGLFPDVYKSKPYPSFLHLECSCFSHGYTCSPMFLPLQRNNYCQYAMLALSAPVPASPKLPLSWHNLV